MFLKVVVYRNVAFAHTNTQKDITELKQRHAICLGTGLYIRDILRSQNENDDFWPDRVALITEVHTIILVIVCLVKLPEMTVFYYVCRPCVDFD